LQNTDTQFQYRIEMDKDLDLDYLKTCSKMTPQERMLKGYELSEWAINLNSLYVEQLKNDLKTGFVLR
jgi:hypothetical protein